jgi:hypothetical protein
VRVSLIFEIIVSFMLFTVFPLVYVLYFKEFLIQDSRGFVILKKIDRICWACAIFRSIPNLQARMDGRTDRRTDRQTDGQTDELIRVRLGNVPPG